MKIMEIDVDRMEVRVSVKDTVAKDMKTKIFFTYKGNITLLETFSKCLEWIDKYGVDQVDVIGGVGVGRIAYDILDKAVSRYARDGSALYELNLYSHGKLS